MKLSVCLPMFFKNTPYHLAIKKTAELGFKYAEFWALPKDADIDAMKKACDEYGVTLIAMCPDKFTLTDDTLHDEYLYSLENACKNANKRVKNVKFSTAIL